MFRHFVKRTRKSISADGSRRARDEATKARLWSAAGRLLPPCAAPHELLDLVWRTNSFVGEALLTFRALLLLLFFSSVFVARPIDPPPVLAALYPLTGCRSVGVAMVGMLMVTVTLVVVAMVAILTGMVVVVVTMAKRYLSDGVGHPNVMPLVEACMSG